MLCGKPNYAAAQQAYKDGTPQMTAGVTAAYPSKQRKVTKGDQRRAPENVLKDNYGMDQTEFNKRVN